MLRRLVLIAALLGLAVGCSGRAGSEIELTASDATPVVGMVFGEGGSDLLVVGPATAGRWDRTWSGLAEAGYRVTVIETRRGSGRSEARDVRAALEAIRPEAVLTEGASLEAVLLADPSTSLVILSPAVTPGIAERMRRVNGPVLFVSALGDRPSVEAQRRLLANTPPPSRGELYPGQGSGLELLHGEGAEEVLADILAFLTGHREEV